MPSVPAGPLRALADHLRDGTPLQPIDRAFLADALDAYLDGAEPLDKALGLRKWGGVSPARAAALADRDRILRTLMEAQPEWSGCEPAVVARKMRAAFERYESGRWLRERHSDTAPAAEPYASFWRILRTGLTMPGARRLSQILAREIQVGVWISCGGPDAPGHAEPLDAPDPEN